MCKTRPVFVVQNVSERAGNEISAGELADSPEVLGSISRCVKSLGYFSLGCSYLPTVMIPALAALWSSEHCFCNRPFMWKLTTSGVGY